MLNIIKLIFIKEMKEAFRDKRSLMTVVGVSVFMPLMMMGGLLFQSVMGERAVEKEYTVIGAEHAPQLISYLEDNGIKIIEEEKKDGITLTIPSDFNEKISTGYLPTLIIRSNFSLENSAIQRLERIVNSFAEEIATARLVTRGISPIVLKPFVVDTQDTSEQSMLKMIAPIFIYMFFMIPLVALLPAGIDSTAGERERNALLPYLLQPIPTITVPIGKLLMLLASGLISLGIAVAVGFTAFSMVKINGVNLGFNMTFFSGLAFVLILIPTLTLFSSLIMAFASFAKSFKEGQTYVGMFTFLPMILFASGFLVEEAWKPFMPIWSEVMVLSSLLSGESIVWGPWLLIVLFYAAVVAATLWWVGFSMERKAISD